jgi:hypothetical protein
MGLTISQILFCVGHWAFYFVLWSITEESWPKLQRFFTFGLTPPATLGFLALKNDEVPKLHIDKDWAAYFQCALMGLAYYAGLAVVFWLLACYAFAKRMNRRRVLRPEGLAREEQAAEKKERLAESMS